MGTSTPRHLRGIRFTRERPLSSFGHASLQDLRAVAGECRRCPLAETRNRVVFGGGNPGARVMLIGEAPGRNEDLTGEPFVGAAGKFLGELLGEAGLSREQVYIANVLKCRPPANRNPQQVEIDTCTPYLRQQIALVDPAILVTLGNFATKYVLGTETGITQLHGRPVKHDERTVMPMFHPAAAIYDRSKRESLFEDFRALGSWLHEQGLPVGESGAAEEDPPSVQDALFGEDK